MKPEDPIDKIVMLLMLLWIFFSAACWAIINWVDGVFK